MNDLIEALQIVEKYMTDYQKKHPTGCEHDVLWLNVDVEKIAYDDFNRLGELSFFPSEEFAGSLVSYRFGSC